MAKILQRKHDYRVNRLLENYQMIWITTGIYVCQNLARARIFLFQDWRIVEADQIEWFTDEPTIFGC